MVIQSDFQILQSITIPMIYRLQLAFLLIYTGSALVNNCSVCLIEQNI